MKTSTFSLFTCMCAALHLTAQTTREPVYTPIQTERIDAVFVPGKPNMDLLQSSVAEVRDVYFLHGLGGSVSSWNLTAENLEMNYKLKEYVPPYGSYVNGNLNSAGKEVHDWVRVNNLNPKNPNRAIMIAHSQGGMVAKAMEYVTLTFPDPTFYPRKFGGLVTFGTPHAGAMILNNGDPYGSKKLIQAFVNEGCQAFGSAEISNLVSSSWAVSSLTYLLNFDQVLNKSIPEAVCGAFSGTVIPLLMDDLASPITTDYNVGSPAVDRLNSMPTQIPVVTFYGEENDPIFYRTISSFLIDARTLTPENPYAADDDTRFVEVANNMMSSYYSDYEFEKEEARLDENAATAAFVAGAAVLIFCPPCAAATLATAIILDANSRAHITASRANLRAYQWLHDANDNWLEIIGASKETIEEYTFNGKCLCNYYTSESAAFNDFPRFSHLTPATSGSCNHDLVAVELYRFSAQLDVSGSMNSCFCEYYADPNRSNPPLFIQREYGAGCPVGDSYEALSLYRRCLEYKEVVRTIVREPNDGVVTAASAAGYPRAVAVRKMRETNHQQMRNCDETRKAFRDLYTGNIPNTNFFYIQER